MDKIGGQFGQAYGAGMAGGGFNPIAFIKKPQVILRVVAWIFSIIVFGCISSGAWYTDISGEEICLYGNANSACGFGTAIGVLSFLALVILLAIDAYFNNISSVQLRKQIVIGDLAVSGAGAFLWFITFCVLTNKWASAGVPDTITGYGKSQPEAAIAFSFFSIFVWGGLTFFAWRRYKEGAANAFAPSYEQDFSTAGVPPYGYPGGMGGAGAESYQEPPFTASNDAATTAPGGQHYQPY